MNVKEISDLYPKSIRSMMSNVIDVYLINLKTPSSIKYDVFARLNEAELRRAIYHSKFTLKVDEFIERY